MIRISIKDKIKEYFFINPTQKIRVRQLERILKVPFPSVIRYTKELEKEGIIKKDRIANITTFSADRTSNKFLLEKKLFNTKNLHDSNLVKHLKQQLSNPTIIVFGSYSRGEDIETSDIDIFIESLSNIKLNLKKFEQTLNRKIHIIMNNKLGDIKNKELANNIINGITLNGFLEVFK